MVNVFLRQQAQTAISVLLGHHQHAHRVAYTARKRQINARNSGGIYMMTSGILNLAAMFFCAPVQKHKIGNTGSHSGFFGTYARKKNFQH